MFKVPKKNVAFAGIAGNRQMNLKLKYFKTGSFKRPLVKISLRNIESQKGQQLEYLALIDSGADMCVFHSDLAPILGIDLKGIKPQIMSGVNKGGDFKTYLQIVNLGVEQYYFDVPVYFSDELASKGYGFLGQQGFFDHFKNIRFEYTKGNIFLKK